MQPVATVRKVISANDLDFVSAFDGRFVAEMGGHGCVKTVHQVLIDELNRRRHDGLAVRTRVKPRLCDGEGRWTTDYVRLRFEARLTN